MLEAAPPRFDHRIRELQLCERQDAAQHSCVINTAHLRRILKAYSHYYHRSRTRLGLQKDTPRLAKSTGLVLPALTFELCACAHIEIEASAARNRIALGVEREAARPKIKGQAVGRNMGSEFSERRINRRTDVGESFRRIPRIVDTASRRNPNVIRAGPRGKEKDLEAVESN